MVQDRSEHPLRVALDNDLNPDKTGESMQSYAQAELERIELDPDGGLTMSCKAVGTNSQAFHWSSRINAVVHQSSLNDEIAQSVRNVNYV